MTSQLDASNGYEIQCHGQQKCSIQSKHGHAITLLLIWVLQIMDKLFVPHATNTVSFQELYSTDNHTIQTQSVPPSSIIDMHLKR